MTKPGKQSWRQPIRTVAGAFVFLLWGAAGASAQQQTFELANPMAGIVAAGPGMVLAVRDDLTSADFIDLMSGEVTGHVDFDGVLQSVAPYETGNGSTGLAVITRLDDIYSMSVVEGGLRSLLPPDVVPSDFVTPSVIAVKDAEGLPLFVIWDRDTAGSAQTYRRYSRTGGGEDIGLKMPYFEFLNFGDNVLLGLQPSSEVAELVVDSYPEDSIFLPGLSFDNPSNFATFVPGIETGGNGKIAIANSETDTLSVLSKEVARLPRLGLPTQAPIGTVGSSGGRLLLLGSPDLSLILVAEEGSRSMASFREIETRGSKGGPSNGGGLQSGNPFELEAPIRDAILSGTKEGEAQFVFLTGEGTTIVTAMVDAVSSAVDVSIDPNADVPFTGGSQDVGSIMRLQKALASLGYPIGAIDGMVGPATNGALRSFQVSMGITASGGFDDETAAALNTTLDDTDFGSADEALAYFSPAQLTGAIGDRPERYKHVESLVPALYEGGYHSRNALAVLLANVIYETSNLRAFEESKTMAARLYEGRTDLGNTSPGDGERYRGRGYLMIVGRSNYERYSKLAGVDLVANPDLALEPEIGAKIAVSVFQDLIPPGSLDSGYVNLSAIRKRINGGMNGLEEVVRVYRSLMPGDAKQ